MQDQKTKKSVVQRRRMKELCVFSVALFIGICTAVSTGSVLFILFTAAVCVAYVWIFQKYWKKVNAKAVVFTGVCIDNDKRISPKEIGKHIVSDKRIYRFFGDGKMLTLYLPAPVSFRQQKTYRLYLPQNCMGENEDGLTASVLSAKEIVKE